MIHVPETFSIALHTLAILAGEPGVYQSGKRIAENCQFSANHLSKVVPLLVRAGLLEARRGPSRGVCFTLDPKEVTLEMIRRAVEGRVAPRKGCLLPHEVCPGKRCVLGCFLSKMEAEFQRVFKSTTLADILRYVQKRKGNNYVKVHLLPM